MSETNIRFLVFMATVVAVIAISAGASVLNHVSEARRARYMAQVCRKHGSAVLDTQPHEAFTEDEKPAGL